MNAPVKPETLAELDYDLLATLIAEKLGASQINEHTLWDGHQCAKYLHVAYEAFRDRISKDSKFPTPVAAPYGKSRSGKLWYAQEILDWAKKQRC
ncbi:hypothetical protein [Marinobacterium litorale]|uniref:hypothetical protein n=1 Tax=Marinobacterium litorale TaxID=404770 RepID=UPI0003F570F0|nr:hypothetical protein [Marinobacterium litorale]